MICSFKKECQSFYLMLRVPLSFSLSHSRLNVLYILTSILYIRFRYLYLIIISISYHKVLLIVIIIHRSTTCLFKRYACVEWFEIRLLNQTSKRQTAWTKLTVVPFRYTASFRYEIALSLFIFSRLRPDIISSYVHIINTDLLWAVYSAVYSY